MRNFLLVYLLLLSGIVGATEDARAIVRAAIDHYRGMSSTARMTMVIHRPDWERSMSMSTWTEGEDRSLVRVLAPTRDAGNGTLTMGDNMWTYTPKINRIIKIPASMMGQNWMGSDFSNRDVARSDDIVDQYTHRLLSTRESDGHRVYEIEARPLEDAAVVWGREVLAVRDDWVLLSHAFYDQDDELVKALDTLEIRQMSGRPVASVMRMVSAEEPGEWTELRTEDIAFDVDLAPSLFTLSSLRNPRQ